MMTSISCNPSVHPHRRGDSAAIRLSLAHRPRFTPTGVGTAQSHADRRIKWHGSPPQAWGQRHLSGWMETLLTVHPHRRGDSLNARSSVICDFRFTPTGVGTATRPTCTSFPLCGSPPQAWGQPHSAFLAALSSAVHPHRRGDSVGLCNNYAGQFRFTPTGVGTAPGCSSM